MSTKCYISGTEQVSPILDDLKPEFQNHLAALLSESEEKQEEIFSNFQIILSEEIYSDESKYVKQFLEIYKDLGVFEKELVTCLMMDLCGWEISTLLERAEKRYSTAHS